jgi:hypothetical protein
VNICPVCGTDNREWASHCGECGKPLPEDGRIDSRPRATGAPQTERLPAWLRPTADERVPPAGAHASNSRRTGSRPAPIPDGGLANSMPSWLGDSAHVAQASPSSPQPRRLPKQPPPPDETPDVTTFLTPEDLPLWLRRLATTSPSGAETATEAVIDVSPGYATTGPAIGDERDDVAAVSTHHALTAPATEEATTSPPERSMTADTAPSKGVSSGTVEQPRTMPVGPGPGHPHLMPLIVAGAVIALLMIAYALYLGFAG